MKALGIFLVVAAIGICVDSSKQHVQYVTAPKSVRAEHAARVAAERKNASEAAELVASASEISPNALAHQQHAQRVALEQQIRIAKLTFGEQSGRPVPQATVIATSIHQPSQSGGPMQSSPVAYTLIRQRQVGAPAEVSQKYLPSPTPLRYHPVMRYMTIIQHPPGTQPQPHVGQAQILSPQYFSIPQPQPQLQQISGSPYASGKQQMIRYISQDSPITTTAAINSGPYRFVSPAKTAASLKSSQSPSAHLGYAGNSFTDGPTSRPLYSPATIPARSKYASLPPPPSDPESDSGSESDSYPYSQPSGPSVDTTSGTNAFIPQQQSSGGPPPLIQEHHHYISDTTEGQALFRGNQASIQPSVQLPPQSLKDLLNDNVDQVYAPRAPPPSHRGPPPPPEEGPSGPSPSYPSMYSQLYSSVPSQSYYAMPQQVQPQPSSHAHSRPIQYTSVSVPASQRGPPAYMTSGPSEPPPPPSKLSAGATGPSGPPQNSPYYAQYAIPQGYVPYQPISGGPQPGVADNLENSLTDADIHSIYNTAY